MSSSSRPPFPSFCRRALPGLKRTIARRHPNSVLSICMSRIFDTSSVRTLQGPSHKKRSWPSFYPNGPFCGPSQTPRRAGHGLIPHYKGHGWIPGMRGEWARPGMPPSHQPLLLTCQRWRRLPHCGHCSCGRGGPWPGESRL